MDFICERKNNSEAIEIKVSYAVNAGYAGANQQTVRAHIEELREMGVPAPKTTPTFYPVAASQLTKSRHIQVGNGQTSAEVEYVFFRTEKGDFVSVGSDHSDRWLESKSVCAAKQICPNVVADKIWPYADIRDHWDEIRLICEINENGAWRTYQDGKASELLTPEELLELGSSCLPESGDIVLYSGTIPTIGKLCFGKQWRIRMADPVLDREIAFEYEVETLPEAVE